MLRIRGPGITGSPVSSVSYVDWAGPFPRLTSTLELPSHAGRSHGKGGVSALRQESTHLEVGWAERLEEDSGAKRQVCGGGWGSNNTPCFSFFFVFLMQGLAV